MSTLIWTGFLILCVIFMIFSLVLLHHWSYYGIRGNKKTFAKALYFIGGVFILVVVAISLVLYQASL